MPRFLTTLPLIAALGLGHGALAQDNTTQTQASEGEAAAAQSATEELSMGEEAAPKVVEPYIKEEHGDWQLKCFPVEEGDEPCQLYQLLKDDLGTDVAEVAIFRLPEGGKAVAGATITVPLETLLTAQLAISVDGGKGKRYPFSFCSPVGCYARVGFTTEDIATFKRGAAGKVTLVPAPAPDQKVELKLSLKGFTAGYAATSVLQN